MHDRSVVTRQVLPAGITSDSHEELLEPRREGTGMAAVHIARIRVYQEKRPNRRAYIGDFPEPVRYGVNAGVKAFYKMEAEEELPSTLDHLVGAAAG